MLKVVELYSGIGAIRKALIRAEIPYQVVASVEFDKYAVQSYNAIFDDNRIPLDVTTWDEDVKCDLLMHGSPCQDFSIAGKQAGADEGTETRSSLMWHSVRIIRKLKPKYVIWENVKNVLSAKHKHNFDKYIEQLNELGYTSYYQVLNAKDYGIPQNRERVFTVSILDDKKGFEFPIGYINSDIITYTLQKQVRKRKNTCNIEELKELLRGRKNISINEISEKLDVNKTLAEHWFRKDNCFSIPDADVWFKLKELLKIETDKFDKFITEFEILDGVYEKANRIYDENGLCPTLTTQDIPEIITYIFPTKQELKLRLKDILEDTVDEKYYLNKYLPLFKLNENISENDIKIQGTIEQNGWHRLMKDVLSQESISTCLNTMQGGNLEPKVIVDSNIKPCVRVNYERDKEEISTTNKEIYQCKCNGGYQDNKVGIKVSPTLRAGNSHTAVYSDYRIRKLTPLECWRLMGFDDIDFYKAQAAGVSNSQLYKQAGNSIVVNVLEQILKNLF